MSLCESFSDIKHVDLSVGNKANFFSRSAIKKLVLCKWNQFSLFRKNNEF